MRGLAPAIRVMSRSDPPAVASGSWPSTRAAPAWFRRMFASAWGRWLVTATSRSWASGSIATGRAPSEVTSAWAARYRSGRVAASGVRNQVAPSKRSALARPGPRASAPQIGWPPTKRGSVPAAAQTEVFVDPTSVTVQSSGAASSTSCTTPESDATGTATRATSASRSASSSEPAGSTAPRSDATSSVAPSSSQPVTSATPVRRAARPTEAPMRPVPTTASRMGEPLKRRA